MNRSAAGKILTLILCFAFMMPFMPAVSLAESPGTGPVVIYEVYGGGGNTDATYKNDYIVLKNIGSVTVDITGWSVQYSSATGVFGSFIVTLTGTLGAGEYYLIKAAAGTGGTVDLPEPDATCNIAMSKSDCKVLLSNNSTSVTGTPDFAANPGIMDFVGIGTANAYLGSGAAPATSNTTALQRQTYTGDNKTDYQLVTPDLSYLSGSVTPSVAAPTAAPAAGAVTAGTEITLASATAGASVYYTTDGSAPSVSSTLYTAPIPVNAAMTIKAIAVKDGISSAVSEFVYTILPAVSAPAANPGAGAVAAGTAVTLTSLTAGASIYFTTDGSAPTESSTLFTAPIPVNAAMTIKAIAIKDSVSSAVSEFAYTIAPVSLIGKGPVVIYEVYGGGGNTGSTYKNDYIVLKNIGSAPVDLTGWTVQYASASGTFNNQAALSGTLAANDYYLIKAAAGTTGGTVDLPPADAVCNINISGSSCKVLLANNTTPVASSAAPNLEAYPGIVDYVGIGTAGAYLGTGTAPIMSNTMANRRQSYTGDNKNDYQTVTPDLSYLEGPFDPIDDASPWFTAGVLNINEANAAAAGSVTVIGQIAYRYGNYNNINTTILQDVIGGDIVALQIYNALAGYDVGDIVKVTGTKSLYGEVPQIGGTVTSEKLGSAAPFAPQEFNTIGEVLSNKDDLLSEYILIKDVTLGIYSSTDTTNITDSASGTIGIYRAATYPAGVAAGETVDLKACLSKYNTTSKKTDQLRVGYSTDYVIKNDTAAPVITLPSFLEAEVGKDYVVAAEVSDNVGVTEVTMTFALGSGTDSAPIVMVLDSTTLKYKATIPGTEIVTGFDTMTLKFTAKDAKGNTSNAETTVNIVDLPQIDSVTPEPNSATHEVKRPEISVTFSNAGTDPGVVLTLNGGAGIAMAATGNTAAYTPDADLADGKYTAKAVITRADGKTAEYTWTFTVGEPIYELYFGQLHSHTAEYSDGTGTLEQAYEYAMNAEQIDFLAVTDHSNMFDSSTNLGDMGDPAKGIKAADGVRTKWQEAQDTADLYNKPEEGFVSLYGYEMTWSGQYGHINTFNSDGFVSRNNAAYTVKNGPGLVAYYDLIKQYPETISMFNHPGSTFGTFEDFSHYDMGADQVINMIEVGNGEGAVRSSAYWPSYQYYNLALDKGWHVAPANNQDNHKGLWGDSNTARTVVITDNFTREGIYEAMRDMSMYATEDNDLEIFYTANDQLMGSIAADKPASVNIYASFSDPDTTDRIGTVSVIVNGGVIAYSETINSNSGVLDVTLPCDYNYYYIRVDEGDKDIAVTAPVWFGDVTKIGVTSVKKDAAMDVKGEEMTISTRLFNYEASELTINSVEYSLAVGRQDPVVLDTVTGVGPVPSMSEITTEYKFTPSQLGSQKLIVTVNGALNGVTHVFTGSISLDVLDSAELVDIAIDAAHSNFYVSGNYADSDANFIELAGKNGVRVHRITESITYDAIKNMKLLVLTVPFKGFGTALGDENLYTADEIAAIKLYADAGGNLVVCSKSDRGSPAAANENASAITNEILAAIGAKARIADGLVVDEARKENEVYRLYFTEDGNYNYSSPFLKDVKETTNNSFSCYNGAPVIPNGADVLIKGYDTTWGTHFADLSSNTVIKPGAAVVTEKGNTAVLSSETLPGGGFLLTSGVTFFSTFEVKVELENSTTKQNSNYQLVINLFDSIKPEPVITNIADVHAAPEGQRFTVVGTVTSNASGYDASTAFFDCIYIQDATGGINLFPVAGDFRIGQKVRVTGVTSSYQGERQLAVNSIRIIDPGIVPVLPEKVRTGAAMDLSNTGRLILIEGKVKSLGYASDGTLETIEVNDGSGAARVFIDGYIMSNYSGLDGLQVNDRIIAIGLGSVDTLGARIRVRDRSEIFGVKSGNIYHAVLVKSNPGGSVSPSGILYVPDGGTAKFTLTPDEGYKVQKVLVNGLETEAADNAFTVADIKGHTVITVVFTPDK